MEIRYSSMRIMSPSCFSRSRLRQCAASLCQEIPHQFSDVSHATNTQTCRYDILLISLIPSSVWRHDAHSAPFSTRMTKRWYRVQNFRELMFEALCKQEKADLDEALCSNGLLTGEHRPRELLVLHHHRFGRRPGGGQ